MATKVLYTFASHSPIHTLMVVGGVYKKHYINEGDWL